MSNILNTNKTNVLNMISIAQNIGTLIGNIQALINARIGFLNNFITTINNQQSVTNPNMTSFDSNLSTMLINLTSLLTATVNIGGTIILPIPLNTPNNTYYEYILTFIMPANRWQRSLPVIPVYNMACQPNIRQLLISTSQYIFLDSSDILALCPLYYTEHHTSEVNTFIEAITNEIQKLNAINNTLAMMSTFSADAILFIQNLVSSFYLYY